MNRDVWDSLLATPSGEQFLMKAVDGNRNFTESKFIRCKIRNLVLIQQSSNLMNIFMKRLSLKLIIAIALTRCHHFNLL